MVLFTKMEDKMLEMQDTLYTVLHLLIIAFNLLGWTWTGTRRAHFISILLTACSWFVLGIWKGWGYCTVTDWQWQVKEKLGEKNIPGSFIEYFGEKVLNHPLDSTTVDKVTLISFLLVAVLSVYVNFFSKKQVPK